VEKKKADQVSPKMADLVENMDQKSVK